MTTLMLLEGGPNAALDIVAKVPHAWSKEKQSAEVRAIALANGASLPFGLVTLIQQFGTGEDAGAEIIAMGGWRAGYGNDDKPLTRNSRREGEPKDEKFFVPPEVPGGCPEERQELLDCIARERRRVTDRE